MAVYTIPTIPMFGSKKINMSYSDEHYFARPAGEPFPYEPLPVIADELNEAFHVPEPQSLFNDTPSKSSLNKDGPKLENKDKKVTFSDEFGVHYFEQEEHEKEDTK